MSKIIDITDKLNFDGKPKIRVGDVEIEANNDAVTMLKVIAIYDNDGAALNTADFLSIYKLLFGEESQRKIEALNLSLDDFMTLIAETAKLLISAQNAEGEAATPATT